MTTSFESVVAPSRASFVPTEKWIEAFEREFAITGLQSRLMRYARMRARMVARTGKRLDDLYAKELVQDAIEDTLTGSVSWDPARCTLEVHLLDTLRSRSRHDYVRANRYRHESLEKAYASDGSHVERGLWEQHPALDADHRSLATRVIEELRSLAVGDADVLSLLGAYSHGATKRVEVLRIWQVPAKQYAAARRRLHRLVLALSNELRTDVFDRA